MHDAPRRDAAGRPVQIRLYLPGVFAEFNAHGRPQHVDHAECVGMWDAEKARWIDTARRTVFPSQWMPLQ